MNTTFSLLVNKTFESRHIIQSPVVNNIQTKVNTVRPGDIYIHQIGEAIFSETLVTRLRNLMVDICLITKVGGQLHILT